MAPSPAILTVLDQRNSQGRPHIQSIDLTDHISTGIVEEVSSFLMICLPEESPDLETSEILKYLQSSQPQQFREFWKVQKWRPRRFLVKGPDHWQIAALTKGFVFVGTRQVQVSTDFSSIFRQQSGVDVWIRMYDLDYDMVGFPALSQLVSSFGTIQDIDSNTRCRTDLSFARVLVRVPHEDLIPPYLWCEVKRAASQSVVVKIRIDLDKKFSPAGPYVPVTQKGEIQHVKFDQGPRAPISSIQHPNTAPNPVLLSNYHMGHAGHAKATGLPPPPLSSSQQLSPHIPGFTPNSQQLIIPSPHASSVVAKPVPAISLPFKQVSFAKTNPIAASSTPQALTSNTGIPGAAAKTLPPVKTAKFKNEANTNKWFNPNYKGSKKNKKQQKILAELKAENEALRAQIQLLNKKDVTSQSLMATDKGKGKELAIDVSVPALDKEVNFNKAALSGSQQASDQSAVQPSSHTQPQASNLSDGDLEVEVGRIGGVDERRDPLHSPTLQQGVADEKHMPHKEGLRKRKAASEASTAFPVTFVMDTMNIDLAPKAPRSSYGGDGGFYLSWNPEDLPMLHKANIGAAKLCLQSRGFATPSYSDNFAKLCLQSRGFATPSYSDSSKVAYVLEGSGVCGLTVPEAEAEKVIPIKEGDSLAIPFGHVTWWFNPNNSNLMILFLGDTSKGHQPGQFTNFHLTGPTGIFIGFTPEFVSRAWDLSEQEVAKLVHNQSNTGIVKLQEGRKMPEASESARNGLVVNCHKAPLDVDIKGGGCVVVLNNKNLPTLESVGLGADLVRLYGGAMCSPGFSCDSAYQVTYIVKGSGRVQVVGIDRKRVLETRVSGGQLFIVPRFFVVSKIADLEGMEWFSIITTPNPVFSHLAGRTGV